MKLRLLLGAVIGLAAGAAAPASPLLDSSEETYASVCIRYDDTPERLIEICTLALDRPGATAAQRMQMRESLGYAYYDKDRYDEAHEVFAAMLARDAADTRALNGLGWVAHDRRDYATARDHFRQSLNVAPSDAALGGLADSLWELDAAEADAVIGYFDAALALNPGYHWARRQKGWVLLDIDRDDAALALFADMVTDDPDDAFARAGLLRASKAVGDFEAALAEANRVLGDWPDYYWFLSERSDVLHRMKRYRQAIRDAERLIALEPETAEGYVRKARPMALLGERANALAFLQDAEGKVGPDPFLVYWRASLLFDDDRLDDALDQIRRNTARDTADAYDFQLLGRIQLSRNAFGAARVAVDRALSLDAGIAYSIYYDAILMLHEAHGVQPAMERFDDAVQAGLPDSTIGEFAGELIAAGYLAHAIAIRAKYAD